MQRPSNPPSITDEEIEAFLATRPWRNEQDITSSEAGAEQSFFDLLTLQQWASSSSSSAASSSTANWQGRPGNLSNSYDDQTNEHSFHRQNQLQQQQQQKQQNVNLSPNILPSSFAAQFLTGTPEHEMLLQALAEQQVQQANPQQTQQHQQYIPPQSQYVQEGSVNQNQHGQQNLLHSPIAMHQPHASTAFAQGNLQHDPRGLQTPTHSSQGLYRSISSPRSDAFSSPEEVVYNRYAYTPSRASQTSLQSLPEQGMPPAAMASPPTLDVGHQATSPTGSARLGRRNSSEIRAIRQRRQVRRTYAGPSHMTSLYSPTSSLIDDVGLGASSSSSSLGSSHSVARNIRSSVRPSSAGGAQGQFTGRVNRPRTGTMSSAASFSSQTPSHLSDEHTFYATSDHSHPHLSGGLGTGIPTSLSAELAGLDLEVPGSGQDVSMSLEDTSMQRASSASSTSTTTKRQTGEAVGDYSLFSQQTSSSSGLDDSILSIGDPTASRWVHGRDTPPSTPSKGSVVPSPSSFVLASSADVSKQAPRTSGGGGSSSSTSSTSGAKLAVSNALSTTEYARTWPRSMSEASSGEAESSMLGTPSMTSSGFLANEGATSRIHSPVQHSYSDNPVIAARLAPHMRAQQPKHPSSIHHQLRQHRSDQIHGAQRNNSSLARQSRSSMRISSSGQLSSESLRSDTGPTRTASTVLGGTSRSALPDAGGRATERSKKRWSTSILAAPPLSSSSSSSSMIDLGAAGQRSLAANLGRTGEADQYDQVSAALDTLRIFLRQRQRSTQPSSPSLSVQSSNADIAMRAQDGESEGRRPRSDSSSSALSAPNRTLRHPPAGPLPPRGSVSAAHSGGAQHGHARRTSSFAARQSLSPSSSLIGETPSHFSSANSPTMGTRAQPTTDAQGKSTGSGVRSSSSFDRIATLEGLAERIRQMRDANQNVRRS